VGVIMGVPKRNPLESTFVYPSPAPAAMRHEREYEENVVAIQIMHEQKDGLEFVFNMLLSKELATRLNLMVGDKLRLSITKESE
jgi:hypothetical protein